MTLQIFGYGFTFNQDDRRVVLHDGIIDFFTLFNAYICSVLWNEFLWIKNIIAKHREKRHNNGGFCGFLCLDRVFQSAHTLSKLFELVYKIHNTHSLSCI